LVNSKGLELLNFSAIYALMTYLLVEEMISDRLALSNTLRSAVVSFQQQRQPLIVHLVLGVVRYNMNQDVATSRLFR
jgi:hypothetical protein